MSSTRRLDDFSTEGLKITTQEEMAEITREKDYSDDSVIFYSSGGGKRIGFNPEDQKLLAEGFEETFREVLSENDVAVNWGAPKGKEHQSQWCYENGTEFLEDVVNTSVADDFEEYRDRWEEVTALLSLPRMLRSFGEEIEERYGELEEQFPNARISLTAGDVMPENLREWVEDKYNIKAVNFYAGTEMGAVAIEVEPGVYKPTNPNMILEILDEDAEVGEDGEVSEEDVYRVDKLDEVEEVTGPILFTAPLREELPLERYRIGDVWKVRGTEDGPRMEFQGREDNVILYSGANVYPEEIDGAVRSLKDQSWKLVVSDENDYVSLNFYLREEVDEERLVEALSHHNGTIDAWYDSGSMNVQVKTYGSKRELGKVLREEYELPEDEEGDIELLNDLGENPKTQKSKRIAFDQSSNVGGLSN